MTQAPLATDAMAQPIAPEDKIDFKKIFPIFVIVLIDLLGLTIIIPLMPLYATAYGASAFQIGMLGATYPIFQFIAAPRMRPKPSSSTYSIWMHRTWRLGKFWPSLPESARTSRKPSAAGGKFWSWLPARRCRGLSARN